MAKVFKPPNRVAWDTPLPSFFLAGSIEMGNAENWQSAIERELEEVECIILNPRRDEWDSSWVQSIDNPIFREQVEWELDGQEKADFIAMYFDPGTKAPITLLELGLFAATDKITVCCPDGFWRKGNVEVVCRRYGIPIVDSLDKLAKDILERIKLFSADPS